ncbi:MAG: amidohydrolase [Ornithinimicrobium sp.]|uniref:amidohydrolase n=1 Tax=Ornithinimicrobium sp. TaxID=1977084 RepID=UPI0026E03F23|nr:amidohydrolase [Ornithinimicrobium sp.]MDO5740877.1 amidohydrolase [Ornithinimicrobium sp.]
MYRHTPVTLVRATSIYTLDGPPVEAMLVSGGRVLATGSAAQLREHPGCTDEVVLEGTVLPGFNDAHAHPTMTAENLLHVDLSPDLVPSQQALVARLQEAALNTPPGEWVRGSRYDHEKSSDGEVLDRAALDSFVPDRPVLLIHVAAHWGVLNSAGLEAAGLSAETPDPPGGSLGRDANGQLTGVVYEQALFDLAYSSLARGGRTVLPASPQAARIEGLERALQMFHAAGITSMCDALCGPEDLELLQAARREGRLTMRVSAVVAHPHFDAMVAAGVMDGLGDEWLRLAGVKAFVDGACAGGNCLVDEPFEGTDDHGMQVVDTQALADLVAKVTAHGTVLAVHANGDRAIRLLLDAHESARQHGAPPGRHRIEHCSIIDEDIVRRIRDLGLVVVPFGSYARFHGGKLVGYYGHERLERMFAHRTLLDAGVPVAGSSDYPCGPFEPLVAFASCVERRTPDGQPIGLSQRISVEEAVHLYTTGAAYATGEEDRKGTLAPGMLADWVELDQDPFAVDPAQLAEVSVRSTWVGGKMVFHSS